MGKRRAEAVVGTKQQDAIKRKKTKKKPGAEDEKPDGVWRPKASRADLSELNKLTGAVLAENDEKLKFELVQKLFEEVKREARAGRLAAKHDASRSLQTLFRFGTQEMRDFLLNELKGNFVALAKDKYGCWLVIALLRYGDETTYAMVLSDFRGNMGRLATHNCAARVLDFAFLKLESKKGVKANPASMKMTLKRLRAEYLGPEFVLFAQDQLAKQTVLQVFKSLDEKKRQRALSALHRIVVRQVEKGIMTFPFAHSIAKLLVECSEAVDKEELESSFMADVIPFVGDACLAMMSSKDGAFVVARCIAHGSAKDRKKFVREFKGHVAEICFHEFGFITLCTLLNVTDDTVLLKKHILSELFQDEQLARLFEFVLADDDQVRGATLVYLLTLTENVKKSFSPFEFNLIQPYGEASKKDSASRAQELREESMKHFQPLAKKHAEKLFVSRTGLDLFVAIASLSQDMDIIQGALIAVEKDVKLLMEPRHQLAFKNLLNDEVARRLLKLVLSGDKLMSILGSNAGCFSIVSLAEAPSTKSEMIKKLQSSKLKKHIVTAAEAANASVGVKILASKLS